MRSGLSDIPAQATTDPFAFGQWVGGKLRQWVTGNGTEPVAEPVINSPFQLNWNKPSTLILIGVGIFVVGAWVTRK